MAQQTINIGASPNDGTGTPLRTAFQYTNSNFSELYTALGGGSGLPGSSGQVIFNDGGTNLAGDTGLTFNKTTDTLGTGRLTTSGDAIVCSSTGDFYVGTTLSPQFKVERATGAATITGDLTVDTSTLKVDSANDRVGVGTASVAAYTNANLVIYGAANGIAAIANSTAYSSLQKNGTDLYLNTNVPGVGSNSGSFIIRHGSSFTEQFRIANDAVCTWSNVGGVAGTAMTLNANGLAIGTTTNYGKLSVAGSIASFASNTIGAVSANSGYVVYSAYAGAGAYISFQPTNSSGTQFEAARIDSNGNLILSSSTVPATLASDYQLTLNATSNTNLRFSYRGSDGVTRVANITLA